jgi:hypothetical protein
VIQFLKLVLSFAPWLSFLIIAHGSMFRLKLGLAVALLLTVAMGLAKLHRGVILWVGLAFFAYASVAVFGFQHMWTIRFMGVLANGALALGTWYGVLAGNPFTLEYAKEHTDPSHWKHPAFIRANMVITSVWGASFTVNALLALLGSLDMMEGLAKELASYAVLLGTCVFTVWYPEYAKRRAMAAEAARN